MPLDLTIPTQCNLTLIQLGEEAVEAELPLWGGQTFHQLGLWIAAGFAGIAVAVALILIFLHATHYSKPYEQRHIIRILLMIPIYASISFLSYKFYRHAIYWEVARDCYEAFAIASFFHLMCHYVEPTLHEQKNYFRSTTPKNWVMPLNWFQPCTGGKEKGIFRIPRSGLTWFNIIWVGVFQYCLLRIICTFAALITEVLDVYCESSLSPAFAHVWIMTIDALAVTIAMYCLIQFYIQLKAPLRHHKPFFKVLCIKLVIFFSFWQSLLISFLSSGTKPVITTGPRVSYIDVKIGIPSVLLCVEMACFAIMHLFAFPYKPYDISKSDSPNAYYHGGFLGWKAIRDAFNPMDFIRASARGFRWLFVGARKRHEDPSYRQHDTPITLSNGVKISTPSPYPRSPTMETEEYKGSGSFGDGSNIEMNPPLRRTQTDEFGDSTKLLNHPQSMPMSNTLNETTPLYAAAGADRSGSVTPQPDERGYQYVPPVSPMLPPAGFGQHDFRRTDSPPSQQRPMGDPYAHQEQHTRRRDEEQGVGFASGEVIYSPHPSQPGQNHRRDGGPPGAGGGGAGPPLHFGQAF